MTLHERVIRFADDGARGRAAAVVSRVFVGIGAVSRLLDGVAESGARRGVVIADGAVAATVAAEVESGLSARGLTTALIAVPAGETSKSAAEAVRLWEALAGLPADRATHVIAVGGGVVGDLAGFVAATFVRGLPVWQVPTTLVAQVDSAIGGKTGINLAAGKNLVGAFWQPVGVACDPAALATLPDREYRSGLAEVVKYGVILDSELFVWLEDSVDSILAREPAAITHLVGRCVDLKATVVEADEFERSGLRAILNYGHTIGHAIENLAGYGRLLHGEAVAMGMTAAARLALATGRLPVEIARRQAALLARFGLPLAPVGIAGLSVEGIVEALSRDKKSLHGRVRFILPTDLGRVGIVDDLDSGLVREVVADLLSGS
ncbi:MAG: 3-dehydroquinate synthase [Planctomycetes bacterium]|nr:3-dehydroquinate synthase [Planctomycetota bacterium]